MSTYEHDYSTAPSVTLPVPIKLPNNRGLRSLRYHASAIPTRIHIDDRRLLDEEAAALGITRAELMRWFIVYGAQALRQQRTGELIEVTP